MYKYLIEHEKTEKSILKDNIINLGQSLNFKKWYKNKYNRELNIEEHLDGYHYPFAHELATAKERDLVEKDGIDWDEYQNYMLHKVKELKNVSDKIPSDLDLIPERDTHDYYLIKKIEKLQRKK